MAVQEKGRCKDRAGNLDDRDGKRGWSQSVSGGRFHEIQGQAQEGFDKGRDLRSGLVADKGEVARGVEMKQGCISTAAGGAEQISGAPNLTQQQQWLGALIAQLTQGNPLLGPGGNNIGSSSSIQHPISYGQANASDVPNVSREGQIRD